MKLSIPLVFAILLAHYISSLYAMLPSPPPPYNSEENTRAITSPGSSEDSIVEEADYGYWNPQPYYNRDHAAPIPHTKLPN
ncbi:hypothetical protein RND81_06G058500 [Saponaria officinalis]|uniref:Secreted protein n=1 Tax=Saponaria officinalis TaxID=3572 RepID=A0AAW1K4E1_SAPOF